MLGAEPVAVLAAVLASAACADALARHGRLRRIGAATLAIILGAALANAGLIPSAAVPHPVYDVFFRSVAPLAIFLMLIEANLAAIRRAGSRMLIAFGLGVAGTVSGVAAAMLLTPMREVLGASAAPLTGMFAATYIGGSSNFNAVALHYGIAQQGATFGGAVAVDNVMTTLWLALMLAAPGLLGRLGLWPGVQPATDSGGANRAATADPVAGLPDTLGLAVPVALGVAALLVSQWLTTAFAGLGVTVPAILVLTTIAIVFAQTRLAARMTLAKPLALFAVYAFLVVVGASADFAALAALGRIAVVLFAFVGILLVVHGAVVFGAGALLRLDVSTLCVASFANVGGPTATAVVAEAHGRDDLVVPGILVGTLGNVLGSYIGFAVAAGFGG